VAALGIVGRQLWIDFCRAHKSDGLGFGKGA
jgi:hypothetical protein